MFGDDFIPSEYYGGEHLLRLFGTFVRINCEIEGKCTRFHLTMMRFVCWRTMCLEIS